MNVAWQGVLSAATTQFQPDQSLDVPATMETGASTLEVVANGIPSAPVSITVN